MGVRLVPDLEEAVPGAGADSHAVLGHAQTADPIVVTGQHACGNRQKSVRTAGHKTLGPQEQTASEGK